MNEKIRQLAADAKLGGAQFEEGVRYYVGTEDTLNKFAELIVRECINCCDDIDVIQKHYLKYGIDQELSASQCIEVIKKHFGVEE